MGFDIIETQIFGESHSAEMRLDFLGIEKGSKFLGDSVLDMLERRKSSRSPWSTPRIEEDEAIFSSGLCSGETVLERGKTYETNGEAITAHVKNTNVKKGDYQSILSIPRPSHADYVAFVKDGKIASGGGRFSGRLTTMLCIAGGIAEDILRQAGIEVVAYVSSVGEKNLGSYLDGADISGFDKNQIERLKSDNFPTLCEEKKQDAVEYIKAIAQTGDSVGGTVECVVLGVKAGSLGDNLMDGLEGKIAYSVFGVPAVKGVEFGRGFGLAKMKGSAANDPFVLEDGQVKTSSNNNGGINGGIANGMPITLRVAVKPTPSISIEQKSVNLLTNEECELKVQGRHDACIVPRAVPAIESAVALAVLDELLVQKIAKTAL